MSKFELAVIVCLVMLTGAHIAVAWVLWIRVVEELDAALDGSGAATNRYGQAGKYSPAVLTWDGVERRKADPRLVGVNLGSYQQPYWVYARGPKRALHADTRKA